MHVILRWRTFLLVTWGLFKILNTLFFSGTVIKDNAKILTVLLYFPHNKSFFTVFSLGWASKNLGTLSLTSVTVIDTRTAVLCSCGTPISRAWTISKWVFTTSRSNASSVKISPVEELILKLGKSNMSTDCESQTLSNLLSVMKIAHKGIGEGYGPTITGFRLL